VLAQAGHPQAALPAAVARLLPTALARYEQHYLAINGQHSALYAGVLEGLQALRSGGLRLACVTNKPQALAEALLATWPAVFEVVVGAQAGLRTKRHPDGLLRACELLGLAPQRCCMVGDSRNDADAARAAGCASVILFTHGYNHGEDVLRVPASAHLAHWQELPVLLQRPQRPLD